MNLRMYEIEGSVTTWVCAESKDQAVSIFKSTCGEEVWNDSLDCYGENAIREMDSQEVFTYYHDGVNPDKNTIENHIEKYCEKPDMFATSDY